MQTFTNNLGTILQVNYGIFYFILSKMYKEKKTPRTVSTYDNMLLFVSQLTTQIIMLEKYFNLLGSTLSDMEILFSLSHFANIEYIFHSLSTKNRFYKFTKLYIHS